MSGNLILLWDTYFFSIRWYTLKFWYTVKKNILCASVYYKFLSNVSDTNLRLCEWTWRWAQKMPLILSCMHARNWRVERCDWAINLSWKYKRRIHSYRSIILSNCHKLRVKNTYRISMSLRRGRNRRNGTCLHVPREKSFWIMTVALFHRISLGRGRRAEVQWLEITDLKGLADKTIECIFWTN